jgi:polyhydroxyalkanoate synthesis regulator phasin
MRLTISNYKEATKNIDFSKLPEAAQDAHKNFDELADFYNDDKDIKEMFDSHFKIVAPYLNKKSKSKKQTPAKTKAKPARPSGGSTKPKKKTSSTTAKKQTTKKATRKPNEVALLPLEIKIIRRYMNLHGKKVTERQVSLLYKVIQKAATEKTIRKSSKYADEIKKIGNDLAKTYKEMDGTCKFEVPESMHDKLKSIIDSYGVTPAIALIKRFINLYGNITIDKAKRLLTSIVNAKKNSKVSKSDKAYERINQVQKHLEDYLDSDKLIVTNIELKGLQGLAGLEK